MRPSDLPNLVYQVFEAKLGMLGLRRLLVSHVCNPMAPCSLVGLPLGLPDGARWEQLLLFGSDSEKFER